MARRRPEPRWLSRLVVDAIHNDQLHEHGGLPGVRDGNVLESALALARHKWHYGSSVDIPALAAAYGFGLAKNHPYHDGNKRIAFLAIVTFLGLNGYELDATDAEVIAVMLAVADGRLSEEHLAAWVRQHAVKQP